MFRIKSSSVHQVYESIVLARCPHPGAMDLRIKKGLSMDFWPWMEDNPAALPFIEYQFIKNGYKFHPLFAVWKLYENEAAVPFLERLAQNGWSVAWSRVCQNPGAIYLM